MAKPILSLSELDEVKSLCSVWVDLIALSRILQFLDDTPLEQLVSMSRSELLERGVNDMWLWAARPALQDKGLDWHMSSEDVAQSSFLREHAA